MRSSIIVAANVVTAASYLALTFQILLLMRSAQVRLNPCWLSKMSYLVIMTFNFQLVSLLKAPRKGNNKFKKNLLVLIVSLSALFAAFIALCGITHALGVLAHLFPSYRPISRTQDVIIVMCAVVSIITALVAYWIFPLILHTFNKFELNGEGNLQHVENYMGEVMEMVNESVTLLSPRFSVLRCNEASKTLFSAAALVGENITDFIHPEDARGFEQAVEQVFSGFGLAPITIEYRVAVRPLAPNAACTPAGSLKPNSAVQHPSQLYKSTSRSISKIYADGPSVHPSSGVPTANVSVADVEEEVSVQTELGPRYRWVESTMCKGVCLSLDCEDEYDLKMITRNIDDRKRHAQEQLDALLAQSRQLDLINAAKLRYISCIAHDLKTPLQSFCFSLDLLQQSGLSAEQLECVQQASVAVDLMKLTISQTMDISKALSGAKLQPRRTTVVLSSLIARVNVIM
jgi:hypothetical protein